MTKLAVVTGISKGLGKSIAQALAEADWEVVGTGRSARPADLADAIAYHQFDAADGRACADFWQQLKAEAAESADADVCLVNNAGGYVGGGLVKAQPQDYEQQLRSNYLAAVYMTQGLVRTFATARIINIISTSALVTTPHDSAYGAAKAASRHFFQSLQQELKPEHYRITNLYPSYIASAGPDPAAIDAQELAHFVVQQAELRASYYVADVTLQPFRQ